MSNDYYILYFPILELECVGIFYQKDVTYWYIYRCREKRTRSGNILIFFHISIENRCSIFFYRFKTLLKIYDGKS